MPERKTPVKRGFIRHLAGVSFVNKRRAFLSDNVLTELLTHLIIGETQLISFPLLLFIDLKPLFLEKRSCRNANFRR